MLVSTITLVEIEVVRKFITYQTITANILRRIIANYPNQQVRISQLKLKLAIIVNFILTALRLRSDNNALSLED
jgi:hypothetical protein